LFLTNYYYSSCNCKVLFLFCVGDYWKLIGFFLNLLVHVERRLERNHATANPRAAPRLSLSTIVVLQLLLRYAPNNARGHQCECECECDARCRRRARAGGGGTNNLPAACRRPPAASDPRRGFPPPPSVRPCVCVCVGTARPAAKAVDGDGDGEMPVMHL
jgi:hypothetical protein